MAHGRESQINVLGVAKTPQGAPGTFFLLEPNIKQSTTTELQGL